MFTMIPTLGSKLIPTSVFIALTVLTIGTTVMGGAKVASGLNSEKTTNIKSPVASVSDKKTETKTTEKAQEVKGAATTNTGNKVPQKTVTTTKPASTGTTLAASALTTTAGSNNSQITETGCIITLFGLQYDVTSLQSSHSGGDIFVCGTDMSAKYQSAHGTNVNRMQPYLVTASTSSPQAPSTTGVGVTSTSQGSANAQSGSTVSTNGGSTTATDWKPSKKCVVTLFGKQYDVTSLQSPTPAGMFDCGTDMTAVYQRVHGTDVTMMIPYLVKSTDTASSNTSGQQSKKHQEERDHEDEEDDD